LLASAALVCFANAGQSLKNEVNYFKLYIFIFMLKIL
jgi:hypothetical protein